MPELPEVETIRRALQQKIPGKRITDILIRDARLRWPVDHVKLEQLIKGQSVAHIGRRAKYLLVRTQKETTLIIHLGMSGRLLLLTESRPFEKHDHVIFYFDDGSELRFRDPRRFGMIDAIPPGGEADYARLKHLGPEPLAPDTDVKALVEKGGRSSRPIKNLLMDAGFLVGVGNIYANEALFQSRIHPLIPSHELTKGQWRSLFLQIQNVLKEAIDKGGTTLNDFVNSDGETGYFQLSLFVYGREGEGCKKCGSAIQRLVLTGRSTFFCPKCQKQ